MEYHLNPEEIYKIDLRNETEWPRDETFKRYFYPMLKKIQNLLGYNSSFYEFLNFIKMKIFLFYFFFS